jgi:2-haloacid dehalogenase
MPIKAVLFDAYGTLLRNEDLMLIPRRIVTDHGLPVPIGDVWRVWTDLYSEATQVPPFRTLREIEEQILLGVLRRFGAGGDPTPYVDLFFEVTTKVELYPEARTVLNALGRVRSAIVSNADQEHLAAWNVTLPVEFILISEAVRAYKPHPLVFQNALQRLGLQPNEVLHVGDSDVDDVKGAKAAGLRVAWVNRDGRSRRADVPPPDFEISDLNGLLTLLEMEGLHDLSTDQLPKEVRAIRRSVEAEGRRGDE